MDNMTIMLEEFSGNFENCQLVRSRENVNIYRLVGRSRISPHSLGLIYVKRSRKLYIVNSLRKWYYGRTSMLDLTSITIEKALRSLSKALNIPYEELSRGRVTQLEIGLNLWTKTPCQRIIPRFAGYKNQPRHLINGETVYFGRKVRPDKKITIYDKGAEIVDCTSPYDLRTRYRMANMFDALARHGYHFPRYELKLADRHAFSVNRLKIDSVADLVKHYGDLYLFMAREARNFILFERIKVRDDMTANDREIAEGLNEMGYTDYLARRQAACTSKTQNGLKTARCKVRREIVSVVDRFGVGTYGSRKFRVDLGRNLVRISKRDPALNLPETFRELFGGGSRG